MKRTFRTIVVAAMAMLTVAFVGCSKEESNNDNSVANNGSNNSGGNASVEWVDLGLPSGLLWATCNVGATYPEEYGDWFAWGETTPKSTYGWNNYRYCTVDGSRELATLTKYNTSSTYGSVDNLTTLDPTDDAATVLLGNGARIPTKEEWEELLNNTTKAWWTISGVYGMQLTATNGNAIFLPASGYRAGTVLIHAGSNCNYWSSSLCADSQGPRNAFYIDCCSDYRFVMFSYRYNGCSIRAVRAR